MARKIAGSDSGGGAGIQADLTTLAFHAYQDTRAITCAIAHNTVGLAQEDALPIGSTTSTLRCKEIIPALTKPVETRDLSNWLVERVMGSRTGDRSLENIDVGFDGHKMETLKIIKVETTNKRVTGCTLSAAIAANLALGQTPSATVEMAKNWDTFFRSSNRANS